MIGSGCNNLSCQKIILPSIEYHLQGASCGLLQGHSEGGGVPGLDHRHCWEGEQVRSFRFHEIKTFFNSSLYINLFQDCEDHWQAQGDWGACQGEGRGALVVAFHQEVLLPWESFRAVWKFSCLEKVFLPPKLSDSLSHPPITQSAVERRFSSQRIWSKVMNLQWRMNGDQWFGCCISGRLSCL